VLKWQAEVPVVVPLQVWGWKVGEVYWPLPGAPFVHDAGPQTVPAVAGLQFPAPSQPAMQLAADTGQAVSLAVVALGEQVPTPLRLHALHVPQDADAQQTKSVQNAPVPHSALLEQVAPLGLAVAQTDPLQPN
jgi:hypothetical protein